MKTKKWLALLLVVAMLVSLLAACDYNRYFDKDDDEDDEEVEQSEQTEQTEQTGQPEQETLVPDTTEPEATTPGTEATAGSTPLLYKVTDSEGDIVWLFGSIHAGDEYFYPLPEYVTSAYEGADALAVEFDVVAFEDDMEAITEISMMMLYTDGTTIKDHVSEETYNAALEILKETNQYIAYYDYFYPTMWCDLIDGIVEENVGVNYDLGIDMHLLNRAHDEGKEIQNIESAKFQFGMLTGYSDELQDLLLQESIAGYYDQDAYAAELNEMMAIWARGNETEFWDYLSEDTEFASEEEERLYKEYNDAMLINRNIGMADFAENALKDGEEVFICVGAAHVIGPDAMVELLRERGYTVELVNA